MVFGAARSFINPVLQSLLPQIVSRENLPQSLATNSTLLKLATILGPVSGGVLYSISSEFSYLACTLFFFVGGDSAVLGKTAVRQPNPRHR